MARLILSARQTRSILCVAAASKRFASSSTQLSTNSAFVGWTAYKPMSKMATSNIAEFSSFSYSTLVRTHRLDHHSLFSSPLDEIGGKYHDQSIRAVANDSRNASKKLGPKSFKKKGQKDLFRADRVLAERTSLSRSQAFTAIKSRRLAIQQQLSKNDLAKYGDEEPPRILVKGPKEKIALDSVIYLDGKIIPRQPPILIAYHKPINVLSAMQEKHSTKKHLGLYLPKKYKKMHPVGRLDYETSGLILFSRDGELTQRLLHPKYSVKRQYIATVTGKVDEPRLRVQLEETGVMTGEGTHFGKLLHVHHLDPHESLLVKACEPAIGERIGSAESGETNDEALRTVLTDDFIFSHVRLAVDEGKHRMVRRMLANCQHPVVELKREKYGEVELGDLGVNEFRECTQAEINWALSLLKKSNASS